MKKKNTRIIAGVLIILVFIFYIIYNFLESKGIWVRDLENPINTRCVNAHCYLYKRNHIHTLYVIVFFCPDVLNVGKPRLYNRVFPKVVGSFVFMIFLTSRPPVCLVVFVFLYKLRS